MYSMTDIFDELPQRKRNQMPMIPNYLPGFVSSRPLQVRSDHGFVKFTNDIKINLNPTTLSKLEQAI